MNTNELKDKLKQKLKELFQFEYQDLDFGIYKIMNYKRTEIETFIDEKLIDNVKKQLNLASEEEINKIKTDFEKIKQKVKKTLGEDAFENGELKEAYRNTPIAKEYYEQKEKVEKIKISEDLEKDIYNHLITFFSRYYDKGDFISKRRYGKKTKYYVPYNCEEILFHWANNDQYYIKTTEYFRKYSFKARGIIVNFRVINAQEEKGNQKAQDKKFFVLHNEIFNFNQDKNILDIFFEHRSLTQEEKELYKKGNSASQDKINEHIIQTLCHTIPENSLAKIIFDTDPTSKTQKSYIERHLYNYTRRNKTDFFIHKDLKNFLEKELDFYIKNEFLDLDDLQVLEQGGYFDKLMIYLIGVKAFRRIAHIIIEFLAQIENFQKKLWEKKKFVINTHYVITLDKIKEYAGENFLEKTIDTILKNEKQIKEWEKLFGIKVTKKQDLIANNGELPINGKQWKKLPVDTKYFPEEFKWNLLIAITKNNKLDEILNGVLIKSENFQALNLLLNKYKEKIQTIYIDPPYNTGNDDFLYKDNYQHSSWLTMMENRLKLAREMMKENGVIFISIDDKELYNLRQIKLFDFVANIIRQTGSTRNMAVNFDIRHEYLCVFSKNKEALKLLEWERDNTSEFSNPDNDPEGKWSTQDLTVRTGGYEYEVPSFNGSKKYKRKWRFPIDRMKEEMGGSPDEDFRDIYKRAQVININSNKKLIIVGKIVFKKDNSTPYYKKYLKDVSGITPHTLWYDIESQKQANKELNEYLFKNVTFNNPKPVGLVKKICKITCDTNDIILDFFAGSGTTAHAVMKLNKEDVGKRKFILVEMADYFDTVIIPRIKKVAYSFNWKEGKPQDMDGNGVFFKYHTLEQYEDALENIEFEQPQKSLYELPDYFVKYMLQWETKNSKTFLNLNAIKDPFNYKLKIFKDYKITEVPVDIIETFNYLLEINVEKYTIKSANDKKYYFVLGEKDNKNILIVWRNFENLDLEKDKQFLEQELPNFSYDELYINGDALVKGFKHIEPVFKSLMFENIN